jgi:hypothetical protein
MNLWIGLWQILWTAESSSSMNLACMIFNCRTLFQYYFIQHSILQAAIKKSMRMRSNVWEFSCWRYIKWIKFCTAKDIYLHAVPNWTKDNSAGKLQDITHNSTFLYQKSMFMILRVHHENYWFTYRLQMLYQMQRLHKTVWNNKNMSALQMHWQTYKPGIIQKQVSHVTVLIICSVGWN